MENQEAQKIYGLSANPANKKLAAELEARGARVVCFPHIETEKAPLDEKSTLLLNDLNEFDWLIFTDVFAADYFLQMLEEKEFDFFQLDAFRICTLGEAVADRLRFAQIHADVVPVSIEIGAVIASLAAYIGEREMDGKRFLLIKRNRATEIENVLEQKGAVVTSMEIYRAGISNSNGENARLKAMLEGGAIDEFVFTAPADFFSLEELASRASLAEILRETKISATDQITLQFLRERSLKVSLFNRK